MSSNLRPARSTWQKSVIITSKVFCQCDNCSLLRKVPDKSSTTTTRRAPQSNKIDKRYHPIKPNPPVTRISRLLRSILSFIINSPYSTEFPADIPYRAHAYYTSKSSVENLSEQSLI